MGKLSKTADAARKAVEKSQGKNTVERTPEQRLADIRKNLDARLAVTPEDQRFLLSFADTAIEKCVTYSHELAKVKEEYVRLSEEVEALRAKNQEFREVYERENSSTTLQVDVVKDPRDLGVGPHGPIVPSHTILGVPYGDTASSSVSDEIETAIKVLKNPDEAVKVLKSEIDRFHDDGGPDFSSTREIGGGFVAIEQTRD